MSGNPKHSTVRFLRLNLIACALVIAILWLRSGIELFVKHIAYSKYLTNARCKFFTVDPDLGLIAKFRCGSTVSAGYNVTYIAHLRS